MVKLKLMSTHSAKIVFIAPAYFKPDDKNYTYDIDPWCSRLVEHKLQKDILYKVMGIKAIYGYSRLVLTSEYYAFGYWTCKTSAEFDADEGPYRFEINSFKYYPPDRIKAIDPDVSSVDYYVPGEYDNSSDE